MDGMDRITYEWILSTDERNHEYKFLRQNGLFQEDIYKMMINYRIHIGMKIANKTATRHEAIKFIEDEYILFLKYQEIIKMSVSGDHINLEELADNRTCKMIGKHIVLAYDYILEWFIIDIEEFLQIIQFCSSNAQYFDASQFDTFLKIVKLKKLDQQVWIELMNMYLSFEFDILCKFFEMACEHFGENSRLFWVKMKDFVTFKYNDTSDRKNLIDNFYQHAISSPHRNISLEFRPQYFKWFITHNDDIETVRGMYSNLYILEPICHELFECMAEYEKIKNEKNIGKRRKVWLDAVNEFGLNDFRVWYKLICFENEFGNKTYAKNVYRHAKGTLDGSLKVSLIVEIKKLNIGLI